LVRRRSEGTPVAYLVGRREFYSLNFRVTPDVLIPRPETELLVVAALDRAKQASSPNGIKIADVGTGSGIIAICLAKNLPTARLTATDISAAALQVAAENVAQHDVADQVELIESDLLAAVSADRRYDIIASNPPYVRSDEMDVLPSDVRDHEPRQALLAGPTGTELIERLTDQAAERLVAGGWLLLEISPTIVDAAEAIFEKHDRFDRQGTIKDLAGLPRVIQAQRRTATP
jgi:release factor glutamine methyltransferase